jgi:hypothetical protein
VLFILSVLSVIALLIRVRLYTYWMDYNNPRIIGEKFMEMQEEFRAQEREEREN